ncbi:hypothetical protein BDR04DRAFT_1123671 [Suillus decipiens]|nr:hypothetical protein BDR04DRAFT_1123671 [Suillus decipiens]
MFGKAHLLTQPLQPLQAELAINILVIGGRIAGLSYSDLSKMLHGGIWLPPNVSKVLFHWGLKHALWQVSTTSSAMEIMKPASLLVLIIGKKRFSEKLEENSSSCISISFFIQHAGLKQVLYDAAIAAGAEVWAGTTVVSVNGGGPHMMVSMGETLLADVVVGADGCLSIVQQAIIGNNVLDAVPYQCLFHNTTVPGETMFIWLGNNCSAVAFHMLLSRGAGMSLCYICGCLPDKRGYAMMIAGEEALT